MRAPSSPDQGTASLLVASSAATQTSGTPSGPAPAATQTRGRLRKRVAKYVKAVLRPVPIGREWALKR